MAAEGPELAVPRDSDWRPSTRDVQGREIARFIATHPCVVIHCWAIWAYKIERQTDAIMKRMSDEFGNSVAFASCNIDVPENLNHLRTWGLANNPTFVLFNEGRHVSLAVGLGEERLRALIAQALASND